MGQRQTYLEVLTWDDSLTFAERQDRGPLQSAFGVGYGESTGQAVEHARRAATIANRAFDQVKEQAVYALLTGGLNVMAIEERTGIPKSEVSRISRRLGRDGDRPGSIATPVGEHRDAVVEQVRAAWGRR